MIIARSKKLQETEAVEFFSRNGNIWVQHNGSIMSFYDLVNKAKKGDIGANKIFSAIKLLMQDKAKQGEIVLNQTSIPEFINKFFNQKNKRLDIFIPNGMINHRGETIPSNVRIDPDEMPGYNA
jgi:hypothetical protein